MPPLHVSASGISFSPSTVLFISPFLPQPFVLTQALLISAVFKKQSPSSRESVGFKILQFNAKISLAGKFVLDDAMTWRDT